MVILTAQTHRILDSLENIEHSRGIKILYACETGSRAWGFPSPDSDYDVRFVYKHEIAWYLSLSEKKDSIEMMLEDGELDITGWDIKKCLKLLYKSNGALLERLQSPIVYCEQGAMSQLLWSYAQRCYSPVTTMHHYLGIARNSFVEVDGKTEVKLKKLFYALRAVLACKWILDRDSIPPIIFMDMLQDLEFSNGLKELIVSLIELKAGQPESYSHPAIPELNNFIKAELAKAERIFPNLPGRKQKQIDLDELFRDIIINY